MNPINYLGRYITGRFENTNEEFVEYAKILVDAGKLDPEILSLDNPDFESPKTAFGKILINDNFLCSVWSFCYYFYVYHEELVVPHYNGERIGNKHLLRFAEEMYRWGLSLKHTYSEWPADAPRPSDHDECEEVNIVNQLFLYAVDYMMCHEFAHIELAPQSGNAIKQELEADSRAFELMLQGRDGNNDMVIYLGIILGLSSILLLSPSERDSETHPNSIYRLDAFVRRIDLPEEHTVWCLINFIIVNWGKEFQKGYTFPTESETFKSRYEEMMTIINNHCNAD